MKIIIEDSVDKSVLDLVIKFVKTLSVGIHKINGLMITKNENLILIV